MTCPGIEGFQNRCGYVVYVEVYNYFCQNCPFNGKSLFFLLIETLEIEKSSCFVGASFSFNYKQKHRKALLCVESTWFRFSSPEKHSTSWKFDVPFFSLLLRSFFVYKSQYTCCSLQSLKHTPLDFPNWRHVLLIFSVDMFGGDFGASWHFSVCQFHALIMMGRY